MPDWPVWTHGMEFGLTEKQLENPEAFGLLPDIYSAVSLIQDAIAALPMQFYRVNADGSEEQIEDGTNPVVALFERANQLETGYDMIHALVGHFLISGNGAIFLDYEGVNQGNAIAATGGNGALVPAQLWTLPTHLMKPVLTKGRTIETYKLYNGGTQPVDVPAGQVVWIPDFATNPDGMGMSRLAPLDLNTHTSYDMERYQRELFKRGGMTAGVYSSDQGIGTEERARLKEDLSVEGEGPENYFRPVILPRNLKWVRSGLSHQEMQFFDASEWSTQKIARVFKIPASLLGIRVGGLGGSDKGIDSDMLLFIRHGLMPITRRVERRINERLFKELFGMPDVRVRFDYSNEPALQAVFLDQATAYQAATGKPCVTVNEGRKRMGLPPDDDERSDSLWAAEDQKAEESAAKMEALANKPMAPPGQQKAALVEDVLRSESDQIRDMQRVAAGHEHARWTEFANVRVRAILKTQRERMVRRALESERSADSARFIDSTSLLSLLEDGRDIAAARKLLRHIFMELGASAASEVAASAAVDVAFSVLSKRSRSWLENGSFEMMKHINETTRGLLKEALADGIGKGETLSQLVSRVNEVFGERIARSAVIARTESHAAMNGGRLEGWTQAQEQTGLKLRKQWLTSKDENVRGTPDGRYKDSEFSHFHADGQSVPVEQPFFVGDRHKKTGEHCMSPGDRTLSAGNRVNCRCTMVVVVDDLPDEISQKATPIEEVLARD